MTVEKVKIEDKFARFTEPWKPKIVGTLNGQLVKLVRFRGPFVWHRHEREDEMFLTLEGRFVMELREGNLEVEAGEFVIIPAGVEHRPAAETEAKVMLFEPATTLNTGDVRSERTVPDPERI